MKEIFNTTFIENTSRALLAISNGDDPSNYNIKHIEILNNIGLLDNNGNLNDKLTRNNVFAVGKEIVKLSIKSTTYSLITLSIPLPIAPPKINERAIFSINFLDLISK